MESNKCISTTTAARAKYHLTLNDLDDYSLSMVFNKLPYLDRTRIESVCQRWYAVGKASWCTYSKHLTIGVDCLLSSDNTAKKKNILEKILQRAGPYLEEITVKRGFNFNRRLTTGITKWIAKRCPNLKRLNTGDLLLNDDDWLACSNLEALTTRAGFKVSRGDGLGLLFHNNKRLRRLAIDGFPWLTASAFDHLDPGQLESLHIAFCLFFEFTAKLIDKLAESLVELKYSSFTCCASNLRHFNKLKNLQSLDLQVELKRPGTEFIADIGKNCQKLERFFLAISGKYTYEKNVFEPLFDLPYLRRLFIILEINKISCDERDRLLQSGTHLEFFAIDPCATCRCGTKSFEFCDRHRRVWL